MIWLLLAAVAAPPTADYGAAPPFDEVRKLGTAAILSRLIDPDSAKISWPYALVPATRKGLFEGRKTGWTACGRINSRNRMGGYSGETWFTIMFNSGQVIDVQIGDPTGGIDPASATCNAWAKDGTLRPAASAPPPIPSASAAAMLQQVQAANEARGIEAAKLGMARGGYGFSSVGTSYGLYIMAVAPGSRAAAAGLKAGDDVLEINGKSTVGMSAGDFMALIKSRPPAGFALKISGREDVHLPPL